MSYGLKIAASFLFTALVVVSLNACVGRDTAMTVLPGPLHPEADTLAGNFLAGRFAQHQQDWDAAQNYMNVVSDIDHENGMMRQRAFLLSLGAGQYAKARRLAEELETSGAGSDLGTIYLACEALSRNAHKNALDILTHLPDDGFGQYTKPLLTAWAHVGLGDKQAALQLLKEHSDPTDPTYNMHAGLIEELTGDMNKAAHHFKIATENGLNLNAAVLVADFFTRYGQPEISDSIYSGLGKLYPFNPFINALSSHAPDRTIPPSISTAAEGAGVALFDLASLLYERKSYDSAQIYGSMVQLLYPKSHFATLMMGDIAALHAQRDKAIGLYESVPPGTSLYWLSRMRIAEVYELEGNFDLSIGLLQELAGRPETKVQALVMLGDTYRKREQFDKALASYDAALESIGELTEEHWPVIYSRGMSLERLNNWPRAEKDLLMALKFQPDNPMILNYIGYSWADKGVHLDKALDYIRRAVSMRPDDGYILDSYGWALYRTGDYAGAVEWLEKSVALVPDDPTILDHLADAYWKNGRENEARFKWRRAQELSKDAAFRSVILHKMRSGVDALPSQIARTESDL